VCSCRRWLPTINTEKCYGVAKAGRTTAPVRRSVYQANPKPDGSGKEFVKLPKGTDYLVGGSSAPK
jgi:uncharacterized membrane protein